jgi:hypothetical protein
MNAVVDPRQADAVNGGRRRCPLCGSTSRRLQKRQTSPSLPPKGANRGPPRPFPLQTGRFLGSAKGAMMLLVAPSGRHPSAASPAVVVGEGHAPVLAVLLAADPRQTSPSLPPKGENRGP